MKIIHNTTRNHYEVIDNVTTFKINEALFDGRKVIAVVVNSNGVTLESVAIFSKEEDAIECLKKVIKFFKYGDNPHASDKDILVLEDKIESSNIQIAGTNKNIHLN